MTSTLTTAYALATGTDADDSLTGTSLDDTLDGGLGADTLVGLSGNDTYWVDNAADVVVEVKNGGAADKVLASVSYTLGAWVEQLELVGTTDINATGNTRDNLLIGNSGRNILSGGDGNDQLSGMQGRDTLLGGNGNDTLDGGVGADSLAGDAGDDVLLGGLDNDLLQGGKGNDVLDGGLGNDTMEGGVGDDVYYVDAADTVVEKASGGVDTVYSLVNFNLGGTNVENLVLQGTGNTLGNGSWADNRIVGNDGNNTLAGLGGNDTLQAGGGADVLSGGTGHDSLEGAAGDDTLIGGDDNDTLMGGAGNDVMSGGLGDDVYNVDSAGDQVNESTNAGIDTVHASVDYTLGLNQENLVLTGAGNLNGVGNTLDNVLQGNAGNNKIQGGRGNDTFIGSAGTDVLDGGLGDDVFNAIEGSTQVRGGDGVDTVNVTSLAVAGQAQGVATWWNTSAGQINAASGKAAVHDVLASSTWATFYAWDGAGGAHSGVMLQQVENLNVAQGSQENDLVFALGNGTHYNGGAGSDAFYADWSAASGTIAWVNDASLQTINGVEVAGMERLLITTGSGDDSINNQAFALGDDIATGAGNDTIATGAGNDTLTGGAGSDLLTTGLGSDTVVLSSTVGADTVTDFVAGEDRVMIAQSGVRVGNGDAVVDGAVVAATSGFAASAELVVISTTVEDDNISLRSAAATIGSATGNYAAGASAVFVVNNGVYTQVLHFVSADGNAQVSADELTLLATLDGTSGTTTADYLFGL